MPSKTPYDTNALIKQTQDMLKQTAEQGTTAFAGSTYDTPAGRTGAVPAITPASMAPTQPVQVETTPTTPVPVVTPYEPVLTTEETQAETQQTDLQKMIAGLTAETSDPFVQDARLKAEQAQGIADKKAKVASFQNINTALQAEAQGIDLQLAQDIQGLQNMAQQGGANVTKGGLAPQQRALQTQAQQAKLGIAIKQYQNNASLAASQGDLASALDYVDRAIQAEFLPKEKALAVAQVNLTNLQNSGVLKRADQKRADARQRQLDAERDAIETAKADKTSIQNLAVQLSKFGVDPTITRKVQGATSFDEALSLASPYMQDPMSKFELENARLDNEARKLDIAYKSKQIALLGRPKEVAEEKLKEAKTNAKIAVDVANDQVAVIDGLMNHVGMQYAVGPYSAQREGMFIGIPGIGGIGDSLPAIINKGKTQEFIGAIGQLISQETMNTLLNLKKSGGTLGALSDSERIMLRNAASKIGAWEIEDPKTKQIVGYGVDEKSFKRELAVLQALARKAATESAGVSLGDDSAEIDALLGVDNISDEELSAYLQ